MNKKLQISIILFIFLFLVGFDAKSQKNPRINKKSFFSKKSDLKSYSKTFHLGEKFYRKEKIRSEALYHYLKLYEYNNSSPALNYKIGVCYLISPNKEKSLNYFLSSNPNIAKDYYYLLGKSYQYNKKFDEAKNSYKKYLETLKKWQQDEQKQKINQLMAECDFGKQMIKDSVDVFIVNLGPIINTYYDEYAACQIPQDPNIYFTTKRPDKEPKKTVSRFKYKERIYMSENCIYHPTELVKELKKINKRTNVSVAGADKKSHRLFYYEGKRNNGRLLIAEYSNKKERWKKQGSVKGKINHIAYRESSISIDENGTAYFVSDRRGSVGGKDIWVAKHKKKNKWGKPKNLGKVINTPFDEEGIFISKDGNTLYFSSKGHPGMGGFDVYKSVKEFDGNWSKPVNMGYPINSPADELFYFPTADTMVAIYSTSRSDGYGGLDIYKIQKDPRKPFSLIGEVRDSETNEILNATINVIDNKTNKTIFSEQTDSTKQMYMVNFEDIGDYSIQVDMAGYMGISEKIECPDEKHATIVKDYKLTLLKHPFTLTGNINDIQTYAPLTARISFKDKETDELYADQFTNLHGKYSITFEDKYAMKIHIDCKDYYPLDTVFDATTNEKDFATSNFMLKATKKTYTLTGVVSNEKDNTPVFAALSFYLPNDRTTPFSVVLSDSINGKYTASFTEKGPFIIEVESNGYFFLSDVFQFQEKQLFSAKNFILKQMSVGAKFVIENILFNTGKSTLKSQSFNELDKLVNLLIKNKNLRIEVSGHTDNVGSASVNKRISKARALTVRNYLISRGIYAERIEYKGYGFDQPIAPNTTPDGRAKNRRVEMKIIE